MTKRIVEIFSAGCPVCEDAVKLVKGMACPSCDVKILDMKNPEIAARAKALGIRSVPAVVIDGMVADCCAGRGIDENVLRTAGLGSEETLKENIVHALEAEGLHAEVGIHRISNEKAAELKLGGSPTVFIDGKELQPQGIAGFS